MKWPNETNPYTSCLALMMIKKRPSVVCGEVNNAIYAMKVVAVMAQLYKELDEHLKRM